VRADPDSRTLISAQYSVIRPRPGSRSAG